MIHMNQIFESGTVPLSRGDLYGLSGQFYECEFLGWDVLVAASVVVGVDEVLVTSFLVDIWEDYLLVVVI